MPLRNLPAKPGSPVIDSGHLLAHLKVAGINVDGDTVIANADGTVTVDTLATTALATAWASYVPPVVVPPKTRNETLKAQVETATTLADLKAFLADKLIPALGE